MRTRAPFFAACGAKARELAKRMTARLFAICYAIQQVLNIILRFPVNGLRNLGHIECIKRWQDSLPPTFFKFFKLTMQEQLL